MKRCPHCNKPLVLTSAQHLRREKKREREKNKHQNAVYKMALRGVPIKEIARRTGRNSGNFKDLLFFVEYERFEPLIKRDDQGAVLPEFRSISRDAYYRSRYRWRSLNGIFHRRTDEELEAKLAAMRAARAALVASEVKS